MLFRSAVDSRAVDVMAPAGGWHKVLDVFECEYLSTVRSNEFAHVVLLIDFDEVEDRRARVEERIPDDVKSRVFVVGSNDEPETLRSELNKVLEEIGRALANECLEDNFTLWGHPHLIHNEAELQRLVEVVKPILFPPN